MARLPRDEFKSFGDDLAPGFDLSISGKDADKATAFFEAVRPLVASVTFEDDEDLSSMLELTLINQPETQAGAPSDWRAVIDSKAFAEGNFIDLFMGYGSQRDFMDRVEIVKWQPTFSESGVGTFTIKGFDGRHRMQQANARVKGIKKKQKRRTFYKNMPDEVIVQKIAEKYGYGTAVDPTEVKKKSTQIFKGGRFITQHVIPTRVQAAGKTDWAFLQKLAHINRFDLWVDYDRRFEQFIVHFKKRQDEGQPIYEFTYNGADGSLISAEPDFSIKDQPTNVEVLHYDRKKRSVELTEIVDNTSAELVKLLGARVGPGQMQARKTLAVGARVRFTAFGETIDAFADKPFRSLKDAANFVQNWLRERERDFLIMQGKVIGLSKLRSRQIHSLRGLGARLDGLYRFTNVKHMQSPGGMYICEFTANKVLSEAIARRAGKR